MNIKIIIDCSLKNDEKFKIFSQKYVFGEGKMIIEVTKENFEEEVLKSKKLTLVDFWGPHCGPCKRLTPVIEKIAEEFSENLKILKVDASQNRRLCIELRVLSLPTIIFFKNGKEIARLSNDLATKNNIRETIVHLLEVDN